MNIPLLYQNGVISKGGSGSLFGQVPRVIRELERVLSFQGGGVMLENEDMLIVQEIEYTFDCIGISLEMFDGKIERFYSKILNSSSRDVWEDKNNNTHTFVDNCSINIFLSSESRQLWNGISFG